EHRDGHDVVGDDLERRLRSRLGESVVAEAGESRSRLLGVEASRDRRLEPAHDDLRGDRVPVGPRARLVAGYRARSGGLGDGGQEASQVERRGLEEDQDVAGDRAGLDAEDRGLSGETRGQSGGDIGPPPKPLDTDAGPAGECEDRSNGRKGNRLLRRPALKRSRLHRETPATARWWRAYRRSSGLLGAYASRLRSRVRRCNATSRPGMYGSWPPRTRRRRRPGARSADAPAPPNHPPCGP